MYAGLEEDMDADRTDREEDEKEKSETESEHSEEEEKEVYDDDLQPLETPYVANTVEELGQQGEACQTEEVADENKSLIWALVKQVEINQFRDATFFSFSFFPLQFLRIFYFSI